MKGDNNINTMKNLLKKLDEPIIKPGPTLLNQTSGSIRQIEISRETSPMNFKSVQMKDESVRLKQALNFKNT